MFKKFQSHAVAFVAGGVVLSFLPTVLLAAVLLVLVAAPHLGLSRKPRLRLFEGEK